MKHASFTFHRSKFANWEKKTQPLFHWSANSFSLVWLSLFETFPFVFSVSSSYSPVLSELQSRVSFSARRPGLGPCFIQVAMVKWSVRFWGTSQSGILAAWWPSNLKINSLSRPLSVTKDAVQLVAALGAGRRSVLPDEAPGVTNVEKNERYDRKYVNNNHGDTYWPKLGYDYLRVKQTAGLNT